LVKVTQGHLSAHHFGFFFQTVELDLALGLAEVQGGSEFFGCAAADV
jgi:hypothetical protein